jgi:RNA-splicing ligase RtcB
MLFSAFDVRIDDGRLHATIRGEPVDRQRHQPAVEVKGATYTALSVAQDKDGLWTARCVVDVCACNPSPLLDEVARMTGPATNAIKGLHKVSDTEWRLEPTGAMRVPVVLYASETLIRDLDDKVLEQAANVATLPGIVGASYAMPDHCGSRGLGHQIGTDYLKRMAVAAPQHGLTLQDRELACAPISSALGQAYLGAMRAGINCALANRQILTHLARRVFTALLGTDPALLYDVSHNTCKLEEHVVDGRRRRLYVHRKGATRAFGPGHPDLPPDLRDAGQPVLIGGTMGTASYILAGDRANGADGRGEHAEVAFASACHGAGRALSRRAATKRWHGRAVQDELAARGIVVRSPSSRGLAEEAPGAYKDVSEVVLAAERAGLARRVARLAPLICIKG